MVGPLSLWFLVNNSPQSSILLLYLFWRHDTSSAEPLSLHNPQGIKDFGILYKEAINRPLLRILFCLYQIRPLILMRISFLPFEDSPIR
jgi:hypothetical protein